MSPAPRRSRQNPARSWHRRARRPLLHAIVAAGPLPVTLLLAHGHGLLILLLTASALAGAVPMSWRSTVPAYG